MQKSLVVIPTYNEAENINDIVNAVMQLDTFFEILIVDDGSPDGTAEMVRELQKVYDGRIHLIERSGKQGLGTAYIRGFKYAIEHGYDYVFEMDADFSHNPKDLERLLYACQTEGFDMAIGSRYSNGVNVVNWPMGRVLMSYCAGIYVRFITGMPINDPTAGFKCYKRVVLETIQLDKIRFIGYAFQIELKFLTWKYGFRIKEVPIIFTDRQKGVSKMSVKIFKEAFLGVIRMKIDSYFKRYIPKKAVPSLQA